MFSLDLDLYVLPDISDNYNLFAKRKLILVQTRLRKRNYELGTLRTKSIKPKNTLERNLVSTWQGMLGRCNNPNDRSYKGYGSEGIFVDDRWYDCATFISDVMNIPGWSSKKCDIIDYQLDKDYFGSNCYSKETCCWLHKKENNLYKRTNRQLLIIEDKSTFNRTKKYVSLSMEDAIKLTGVTKSKIKTSIKNNKTVLCEHSNFKFIDITSILRDSEFVLRYGIIYSEPNRLLKKLKEELY